ncbi:Na+/H+ antiporter subunit E [candidate division KSB1 bacterium]|nr:Na+/H+ antiporter subunit E [candidate division KSB1 bacterium]
MKIEMKSRIVVFVLAYLVWLALTHIGDIQEVIAGFIISIVVALIAGKFFITTKKQKGTVRRIIAAVIYIFKFLWEMIKANFHVAYIVIHPMLPIKPGIVKIRTRLSKDSAITILTNSITLTPGTLTVDLNPDKKEIYVHCIDVISADVEENTRNIGNRFESILTEVFE